MLSEEEQLRYSRHLLLPEIGTAGQEKLKQAKVLVVGAGGLGCPVLMYLAAAGVGKLGIVDFDVVEETNLQRQVLFGIQDIGKLKSEMAREKLLKQNPLIEIQSIAQRLTVENALDLFSRYDIVVDGTDNFSTRYLVNDACVLTGKPFVSGSISRFDGQLSVFNFINGPTYRCLFPSPPEPGSVPSCSEAGVLGVLPGILGSMMACEVIKMITGSGEVLSGKVALLNTLTLGLQILHLERSQKAMKEVPADKPAFLKTDYVQFCEGKNTGINEISAEELESWLAKSTPLQLMDVREPGELPAAPEQGCLNIPLGKIGNEDSENRIPRDKKVVVFCHSGSRSRKAIETLSAAHGFTNLLNLKGGVMEWLKTRVNA